MDAATILTHIKTLSDGQFLLLLDYLKLEEVERRERLIKELEKQIR